MTRKSVVLAALLAAATATAGCMAGEVDPIHTDTGAPATESALAADCGSTGVASVTASADDGNLPPNVLDGNLATRWSARGVGQYITADLGTTTQVCGVGIAWFNGNTRSANFVVSTSTDGATFTVAFTGKSSGTTLALETYALAPVQARYIRITVNGNSLNTWASITELAAYGAGFVHPGVGVGLPQLDFVKAKIAANAEPWKSALAKVQGSRFGKLTYVPRPVPQVKCAAGTGKAYIAAHPELGLKEAGCQEQLDDAAAAYSHALLWYFTGNRAHALKSIEIMNAWSGTLTDVAFGQPRTDLNQQIFGNGYLQVGWSAEPLLRAAEIIRYTFKPTGSETAFNLTKFTSMLKNVYLPIILPGGAKRDGWNGYAHNGSQTMMAAHINAGIFLNDQAMYEQGITEFRNRVAASIYMVGDNPSAYTNLKGMPFPAKGSIYDKPTVAASTIAGLWSYPTKYISGLEGETCRDVSHMAMGFGAMANSMESARIQGTNLYGEFQTRLVTSLELNAGYINAALDGKALTNWVCPAPLNWAGTGYKIGWEIAYNAYGVRRAVNMPNTKALVMRVRPATTGLHMNWETLTNAGVP